LLDPQYNAAAALAISKRGADWSPWSAYTSGRYAQYLPGASVMSPAGLGVLALVVGLVALRRASAPLF
jgi:hypothetical protein